ncbi:MAG: 5-deoxy-glucuronate isomerase [Myxococcaceae bacterium]|nr:5-deoxy-glucuronate isomerase [Myxococcaceae bacterium]
MRYSSENLVVRSKLKPGEFGLVNQVTPQSAGWEHLSAEVRRLRAGESFQWSSGEHEAVLVVLGGRCAVSSNRGEWKDLGARATVFDGLPHALYLPRRTELMLTATSERVQVAWAWAKTDRDGQARHIRPEDCAIEERGGGNASRQITSVVPPGFGNHRLVAVEVYTPGGNWSSYPPHKHDVHREGADGKLIEADLEELYFYQQRKPDGFAFQRVYTEDGALDATVTARHDDFVLIPFGHHPVSAPWGYDCYYLNFLAGSAQSLAAADDPAHAWVKGTYQTKDPRIPMVKR